MPGLPGYPGRQGPKVSFEVLIASDLVFFDITGMLILILSVSALQGSQGFQGFAGANGEKGTRV